MPSSPPSQPAGVPDPDAAAAGAPPAEAARATMDVLAASPDVFATFFEQARIGLALADLAGRYVRVNATYAEMIGKQPEDLVGQPFTSVLQTDGGRAENGNQDRDEDRHGGEAIDEAAVRLLLRGAGGGALQTEERYVHADGRERWVLHGVTLVPGPDGRPAWFAVSAQDITERRRAEQDLRQLAAVLSERAVRDELTGLANRSLLEERLRAALARDARSGRTTAVLFMDLDGFKEINDRHGHQTGDAVLRMVAGRLTSAVRPSDTAARIGGDEFVVLVESSEPADLDALVRRLRRVVSAPLEIRGIGELRVGVSVGAAWCRAGEEDPRSLLRRADAAMYADKRQRGAGPGGREPPH